MNVYANRYGVTIDGKHSFRDYHMLPTTPPVIEPPEPVTYTVAVPGMDGELDMSESLTGHVQFGMRSGHMGFLMYCPREQWYVRYRELLSAFHGQKCDVVLDEESDVRYRGRLQISSVEFDGRTGRAMLEIEGTFDPWPMKIANADAEWLWDPFNFESGVLEEYIPLGTYTIPRSSTEEISVVISSEQVTGNPLIFIWDSGGTRGRIGIVDPVGDTKFLDQIGVEYDNLGWSADAAGTLSITVKNTFSTFANVTISVYAKRTGE